MGSLRYALQIPASIREQAAIVTGRQQRAHGNRGTTAQAPVFPHALFTPGMTSYPCRNHREHPMSKSTRLLALLTLSYASMLPAQATTGPSRSFEHDVLLDGKTIGFHRFTLQDTSHGVRVTAHARFVVTLLGLKVFDYDHQIKEEWRGTCLERMDATTKQNGQTSRVEGDSASRVFTVRKDESSKSLEDCVASFAYWDKTRLLQRTALLNPQTGEYVPVTIESLGMQSEPMTSGQPLVERYRILGRQIDITVSYAASTGQWEALESRLENGRSLQYRLKSAHPTPSLPAVASTR